MSAATTGESVRAPDLDTLARVLAAEQADGCRDHIVVGGLERFLARWARGASAVSLDGQDAASQISGRLRDYAQQPVHQRSTAICEVLQALECRAGARAAPVGGTSGRKPRAARGSQPQEVTLGSQATALPGVAAAIAQKLQRLGVRTVEDLLFLFPRRHEDFTNLRTIQQLLYGEEATVVAKVEEVRNHRTARGIQLTRVVVSDETGLIEATWFNQPYLTRVFVPGRSIVLSGRIDEFQGRLTMQSPQWEPWSGDLTHTGRLVPVYPLTEGLTARRMRSLVKPVVERWAPRLIDPLPVALRQRHGLEELPIAMRQMHFPDNREVLERARQRLCFDEFLWIQLGVLRKRLSWQQQVGRPLARDQQAVDAIVGALPFTLTLAQQRVLAEIVADLGKACPMSRLLQGDVGSGKTIVALLAMLMAVANDMQAVMMAPTEVLADQHFRTLNSMLVSIASQLPGRSEGAESLLRRARVGLLKGSFSQAEKDEQRRKIATGDLNIVVGTHALIQEGVAFSNLGLAIVDEQHRFGVDQRAALRQKGYNPHVLVMSATPIPRTLALTIYGDLDVSVIDELPPHRQRILTRWVRPEQRDDAYTFVRYEVAKGRQAFVICPLVEESELIVAKAATAEYRRLQDQVFPDLRLGLLHGRMKAADKDEVMTRFQQGKLDVLISTAVVEVGIDVPNATAMLVEGADRFGLAQLHQFRGRVGRGDHQSHCLLLSDSRSPEAQHRLGVVSSTFDGFALAEEDLRMRGPGEFFGTRQTGLPNLRLARFSDMRVLEKARQAAQELLREDPDLLQPEHQLLAEKVRKFWTAQADLS